jgi:hypothetical protein
MTHEQMAEMLGAYALHAVEPAEAEVIETHLETCPRCRAEVAEHREVAALLGNTGGDAPEGLWDRIAATLEPSPPPMRLAVPEAPAPVVSLSHRRRPSRVAVALAGVAAAVVIGVLASQVVHQGRELDDVQAALHDDVSLRAANAALLDRHAQRTTLSSPDGSVTVEAVLLADGTGYLLVEALQSLDEARTYQLWGQTSSGLISLGLLGADPGAVVPFRASGAVSALALTDEVAAGVPQPTSAPLLMGQFT